MDEKSFLVECKYDIFSRNNFFERKTNSPIDRAIYIQSAQHYHSTLPTFHPNGKLWIIEKFCLLFALVPNSMIMVSFKGHFDIIKRTSSIAVFLVKILLFDRRDFLEFCDLWWEDNDKCQMAKSKRCSSDCNRLSRSKYILWYQRWYAFQTSSLNMGSF